MIKISRIVNIVTQMEAGGAQQVAMNVTSKLRTKGHDAEVWFLYEKSPTYRGYDGVSVIYNKEPSSILHFFYILIRLFKLLKKHKPDVVISHTSIPNVIGQIAALLAKVPARLAVQHNPVYTYSRIARVLDFFAGTLGIYNRNIIVSNAVLSSIDSYPAMYKKRIRVINYGISFPKVTMEKTAAREYLELPLEGPIIVNIGRLAHQKNQQLLIKILADLPDIYLAIAGEGELRPLLENTARSLGVSNRLFLLGEIAPDEIANVFVAGDLFVFPSIYEAAGLAMVEAIHVGLPVIASDIPGIREVLEDSEGKVAGILVTFNDQNGFCKAIKKVLNTPEYYNFLVNQGQSKVIKKYDLERMVNEYERCFLELTHGTR